MKVWASAVLEPPPTLITRLRPLLTTLLQNTTLQRIMGAPELPNDPGDDIRSSNVAHLPPIPSDDSDESDEGAYDGYQPLAMEDHHEDFGHMQVEVEGDSNGDYNRENVNRIQSNRDLGDDEPEEVTHGDPSIPQIENIDAEIEREVWNLPRPIELQIELDGNKTQQILTAMATFQLPNLAIPDWAAGVPEEHWKEELLQRIRQRAPTDGNSKSEIDKETK